MPQLSFRSLVLTVSALVISIITAVVLSPDSSTMSQEVCPGDSIIPSPEMHYNHGVKVHAPSDVVFPWVLQLGKGRGGWYLPASWEKVLPKSMHASRRINTAWTDLRVGDRVDDYGFDSKDYFDVAEVVPNHALVYKSERYGTIFTWTILVNDLDQPGWSEVRLRFRGRIQSTGLKRKLLVTGGGWMDWLTTWPMLRGLKERAEKAHGR